MQFWLCRDRYETYQLTNYCPYRSSNALEGLWFYYPHWLGGTPFSKVLGKEDIKTFGEIPALTCKNLVTGEIVTYKDLLPINEWDGKRYYPWRV